MLVKFTRPNSVYSVQLGNLSFNITNEGIYIPYTLKPELERKLGRRPDIQIFDNVSRFEDFSANEARAYYNSPRRELILTSQKRTNVSGNLNGGGTGNKPILGVHGYCGLPVSQLPQVELFAEFRTKDTSVDADEIQLGVSMNVIIDLQDEGTPGPFVVLNATKTIAPVGPPPQDRYGNTGSKAHLDEFNIATDVFYIVGNLPSYTGGLTWFNNPVTLAQLLEGGGDYSKGYPNAKLADCDSSGLLSFDGGHTSGVKLSAITLQIGDSSNSRRATTAITGLLLNGIDVLDE